MKLITSAYCSKKLNFENTQLSDDSPTVDRVDPNSGYIRDNCVVSCWRCNRIKYNADLNELITLVKGLKRVIKDKGIVVIKRSPPKRLNRKVEWF